MKSEQKMRWMWLCLGVVVGVGIATLWPHEPALADMSDRDQQFTMSTAQIELLNPLEGVFVTDLVSGTLRGAVLNRQFGKFSVFYYRDLNKDFLVDTGRQARYAVVNGQVQLASRAGVQFGASAIYVAELTTGKLIAYSFPYRDIPDVVPPIELIPLDQFSWRAPDPGK